MAQEIKVVSKEEVVPFDPGYLAKGASAVNIKVVTGKRTLMQRKITNALFKIAQDDGLNKNTFWTTSSKFRHYSGFNSNDFKMQKDAANALIDMKVEFDVLNEQNVRSVGTSNLFSTIVFRSDGKIYFEIPELTKRMLIDEERFALINMQVQADIDSNYAYILYEHCLVYIKDGRTPVLTVQELRDYLEIEDVPTYAQFKHFNNKVIKYAVNEVNKIGDIQIDPIYIKNGREVSHIYFNVNKKAQALLNFNALNESLELQEKLVFDFGVSEKVAEKLVKDYERDRVIGNMEYTKQQFEAGRVSDLSAFLVKAIKDDYRPKEPALVKQAKEKEQKIKESVEIELARKKASNEKVKNENDDAQNYLDNLSGADRDTLLEDFGDYLANNNKLIATQFRKSGLKAIIVKKALLQFIRETKF